MPQSWAALPWLSNAPAPAARTAAFQRPRCQIRASDGEDAAMYAVQTAALNPVIDGAVAVPVLMKLCPRDNSMLETSQSPHVRTPPGRSVCEFPHHDPRKATQMADSPPVPGLVAPFPAVFG
jgi:hypothetical protein